MNPWVYLIRSNAKVNLHILTNVILHIATEFQGNFS